MDIKQLIGETTDYDKKLALEEKKPKSWCKSISAFANCFGGKLIFGVSNDSELVGFADAEGDAEKISESIKIHLNPIPEFKLSFEKDHLMRKKRSTNIIFLQLSCSRKITFERFELKI